jgi:hypothetical protein
MEGLSTQCSNTASHIRHNCSAIFRILNTNLIDPEQQKAKFCGHIGWVPNEGRGSTYSSVDIDIIHKNYSSKYELSKIFLSLVLIVVSTQIFLLLQYIDALLALHCSHPWTNISKKFYA